MSNRSKWVRDNLKEIREKTHDWRHDTSKIATNVLSTLVQKAAVELGTEARAWFSEQLGKKLMKGENLSNIHAIKDDFEKVKQDIWPDTPIRTAIPAPYGARIANALMSLGVVTLEDLSEVDYGLLRKAEGVGEKSLDMIQLALDSAGLSFNRPKYILPKSIAIESVSTLELIRNYAKSIQAEIDSLLELQKKKEDKTEEITTLEDSSEV